jgi:hypothetical protein
VILPKYICSLIYNKKNILKMKNLKLVALIALVLNLVNVSCSSDDDNKIKGLDNVMTIEGNQIAIENGFLAFSQENNSTNGTGIFYWEVNLVSEGFTANIPERSISGIGDFISLDLVSKSDLEIIPGIYTYAEGSADFTCSRAQASTNHNTETEEGNSFNAVSGTITITGTGLNQVIVANLIGENGKAITASYKGVLQVI